MSIVLPDTLQVPSYLTEALIEDCEYYKIENFDLSELVNRNFIDCFVKEGELNEHKETFFPSEKPKINEF